MFKAPKFKGLRPKTIDAYACAIRRIGEYFSDQINDLSEQQLMTCFSDLLGAAFLWLILQPILPKGFLRARHFGFLHSNCEHLIALIQYRFGFDPHRALALIKKRPQPTCRCCGAAMAVKSAYFTDLAIMLGLEVSRFKKRYFLCQF